MGISWLGSCRLCYKEFKVSTTEELKKKITAHIRKEHWEYVGFKRKPKG